MAKAIRIFCTVCAVAFLAAVIILSLFSLSLKVIPFVLIGLTLSLFTVYLLKKRLKPIKRFEWLLFALRLTLAIAFIFITDAVSGSDFGRMFEAAKDISKGSREYLQNDYFYRFPYQTGFAAYEGLILFLTNGSKLVLQLLNAVYMAFSNMLLYLIAKRFVSETSAQAAGVLYALYPAPLFLAGVLTNQHLAVLLLFLAVYILVRKELTPLGCAAAGAVIALGNVMWPVGIIVMLAGCIWAIVEVIKKYSVLKLISAALIPVSYFITGAVLSFVIVITGLNPEGLTNNRSKWMFVVGFSQNGSWNQEDYDKYMFLPEDEVDEKMADAAKERITEMGPLGIIKLFLRKCKIIWGNPEDTSWGFGHKEGGLWQAVRGALAGFDKGVYLSAFLLAAYGLWCSLIKKEDIQKGLLPLLIFCGYFGVYLIIEVQSRYKYTGALAVFILAALGIEYFRRKNEGTDDKRKSEEGLQY